MFMINVKNTIILFLMGRCLGDADFRRNETRLEVRIALVIGGRFRFALRERRLDKGTEPKPKRCWVKVGGKEESLMLDKRSIVASIAALSFGIAASIAPASAAFRTGGGGFHGGGFHGGGGWRGGGWHGGGWRGGYGYRGWGWGGPAIVGGLAAGALLGGYYGGYYGGPYYGGPGYSCYDRYGNYIC